MFDKKEQMIREHRTVEAMKNGLIGSEGKLARVAKAMGRPLYRQGGGNFEQTFLEDPYDLPGDDLPVMDEEEMSYQIGWHFDGMSRGLHMEILWKPDHREVKCCWKGNVVYKEVGGELDGYAPGEWEIELDKIFEQTKRTERKDRKEKSKEIGSEAKRKQKEFLDAMKLKWGI